MHLAAALGFTDWEQALSANIVGAYNVYEAARLAGVKRVVFASSGSTVRGIERMPSYDALTTGRYDDVLEQFAKVTHEAVQPTDVYGASKVWGEAIGRYFSDVHGLSVLCVRIGWVGQDDHPKTPGQISLYLSHRDVVQMLERCIEAPPELPYDIFFATSNNRWGYQDLEHARQVLDYEAPGLAPRRSVSLRLLRPNDQHRAVGVAYDTVCHATQQPAAHARVAVGGQRHQVALSLQGDIHDLAAGVATDHQPRHVAHALPQQLLFGLLQVGLGIRVQRLEQLATRLGHVGGESGHIREVGDGAHEDDVQAQGLCQGDGVGKHLLGHRRAVHRDDQRLDLGGRFLRLLALGADHQKGVGGLV